MSNLGNLAATVSLNIDPFQQSARVLETQTRSIDRALKASETAWKNNAKNINAQKSQYELTGKAIEVHNSMLQKQREKYNGLKAEIGDVNQATVQQKTDLLAAEAAINKTATEIESLTGKYNALGKQIAISESNWTKSGKVLESIGKKASDIGDGLSSFGTKMTIGVTVPIVAGVTAVTKAAVDWESSFAGVKKTNEEVKNSNGQVVYSYADLESGLRNLSKELPSSHTQIAAVAQAAGQLGIKTQDVVGFTKVMLDMGESTNLSAEDAATAIAKIANITGLTSDEYQRFGSSVVALGNNFATTESDIVDMTNRLASAGTLAGLTNQEILGLATAMSSVGIDAEAGGTAMTQTLTAIEQAAASGGEQLDKFANIAGMSSEQFANTWKSKPIEAIQAFIKGLGELDSKGESATLVLDEMGLSGVRQSNMLKSLALASDTMTSAVDMSNKAWKENTALTKEANTRYETTESKLKMLKNEINDTAIDLGGPFVDALRNGLTAIKPTIEHLGELAKKFNNLDTEQQQNIIKWIGMAAAIGPASKLLGGFLKLTGGGLSTVGKLNQWIGTGATSFTTFGTAAASAAGSNGVGSMVTVLGSGGLAGALPAIVGAGGLLAVGYGAWKLFGEEAWNSSQRVQRWGTDVSESTDEALQSLQSNTQKATGEFSLLEQGISSNTESIVGNFSKMGKSIESEMTNRITALKKMVNELPNDIQQAADNLTDSEISKQEEYLQVVKDNNAKITQIRKTASDNNRALTYEDTMRIKQLNDESAISYVQSLGKSQKETKQILTAMTGDVSQASEAQAREWLQNLGKQRQNSKLEYNGMLEDLKTNLVDAGYDLNSDYAKQMIGLLEKSSSSASKITEDQMSVILAKYPELANEVFLANGQLISSMGDASSSAVAQNKKMMESFTDFSEKASLAAKENQEKIKLVLDESNTFGEYWNSLVLDPKTGEIKTNAQDAVNEAAKSEAGWNQLMWIGKDANVSSNVKLMIAEAAIANGKWDSMSFTEQQALIESNATKTITQALQANGDWNKLTFDQKKAILYSNTPEKMTETLTQLGLWDAYNPQIKELNAENYDFMSKVAESENSLNLYNSIPADLKKLIAEDPATLTINQAKQVLDYYNSVKPDLKKLLGNNDNVMTVVSNADNILRVYQRNNPDPKKLSVIADTSGATIAQQAINAVQGKRVVVEVEYHGRKTGAGALANATGSPYFQGGLTWLGDGGKSEPFLTPQGDFGVSPATWTMFDLPRGTKIWPSITKFMESLPRYAEGTKFDDTVISRLTFNGTSRNDNKLDRLINLMERFFSGEKKLVAEGNVYIDDVREVGRVIAPIVKKTNDMNDTMMRKIRGCSIG